jgi:hypothetical protein
MFARILELYLLTFLDELKRTEVKRALLLGDFVVSIVT